MFPQHDFCYAKYYITNSVAKKSTDVSVLLQKTKEEEVLQHESCCRKL